MTKTIDRGKEEIAALCRYFTTNRLPFLAPGVKEAHIRQTLIDPLFEALGWDVRNQAMAAPQYREVIPEDSLDVEGQQKAPDYTFRVGTLPKFYVEAKKCGVNIGSDPGPAFQIRRYGWSAKLALSLLTDFEELAVYDCTVRPRPSDKASYARIQHFRYNEYPDRWRELWDLFSREAVWSGAFDQYAASKRKRGTSEVDEEFLKELEGWRLALAGNIALRNKNLSLDDLNAAVQLIIDRVVFLRMAEDRGLEPYEQLLKLCERPEIYSRFIRDICRKADQKYNSGLFHFHKESGVPEDPDQITPKLATDDKIFKPILESLYFAHGSPYHFGVLSVEILGTVYERFLGKVIRLTAGHQAKIDEKPEARKAGGVYYTPTYIVEYIVKNTVGRQIEGRSPTQLTGSKDKPPFRILDMACGSGSFLLNAYQCLLDYYLKWYIDHRPETFKKAVYKDIRNGQWRLTIEEKKRILTTHIFGVDIDPQAVEVSKLSLLLKVLEGETDQSLSLSQLPFRERALPNLAANIKCGNSLIGADYFAGKLFTEEIKIVRPFEWQRGFPDAMRNGGFDCIIGNPPWVSLTGRFRNDICTEDAIKYLIQTYSGNTYMPNMYEYFVSRGTTLVKKGGRFGYIVPDRLGFNKQFVQLRKRILDSFQIESLIYKMPFPDVTADTLVFILKREPCPDGHRIVISEFGLSPLSIPQKEFRESTEHEWLYFADSSQMALIKRIAAGPSVIPLSDTCKTTSGYGGKSELVTDDRQNKRQVLTIKGDSIVRYFMRKHYWFEIQTRKYNWPHY
jgi:type I restriction-modification system DNA methylase subunit